MRMSFSTSISQSNSPEYGTQELMHISPRQARWPIVLPTNDFKEFYSTPWEISLSTGGPDANVQEANATKSFSGAGRLLVKLEKELYQSGETTKSY